jgi:hypothetical protein
MEISLLNHDHIDKAKWDKTIHAAANGLVFANSWFLDAVSPGWMALVSGDYETIMPVTIKNKWGLTYVVQPPWAKYIAVFTTGNGIEQETERFLKALLEQYRFIRINLKTDLREPCFSGFYFEKMVNHELDLTLSYESIAINYKRRCKRHLKTALEGKVTIGKMISMDQVFGFWKTTCHFISEKKKGTFINLLKKILISLVDAKYHSFAAYNLKGEPIAFSLILEDKNRFYYILNGSNNEGIQLQAMYLLTDNMLKKFSGSGKIFDWTGSSIKNIAYFIESFGAVPRPYYYMVSNKLPFPIKYLV